MLENQPNLGEKLLLSRVPIESIRNQGEVRGRMSECPSRPSRRITRPQEGARDRNLYEIHVQFLIHKYIKYLASSRLRDRQSAGKVQRHLRADYQLVYSPPASERLGELREPSPHGPRAFDL